MKNIRKINFLLILIVSAFLSAQSTPILDGQKKAIRVLSSQNGFAEESLQNYLISEYGVQLSQLTQSQGAELIKKFQSGNVTPSAVEKEQTIKNNNQKKRLLAASVLEEGMKKRFHFRDGSIREGTITAVQDDNVTLKTESGEFMIPKSEFLAETAEITNKKGEVYVGAVLSETDEVFELRTDYGDATIHKREIEKMKRYHGGILDKKTEERRRFYTSEEQLISVFLDPTANPLKGNTFYLSGLSIGYGLTDRFMITTKFGSNFVGDLNLHPKMRFYHKKTADKEKSMAWGLGFHRSYPVESIIGKYSHAIIVNDSTPTLNLNETSLETSDVMKSDLNNPMYIEAYLVFTSQRVNPTGRGKVGWTVGGKVSNAFNGRDEWLKKEYSWDEESLYKIPFRLWTTLDYDLRKDLKLVASIWIDNGYKTLELSNVLDDYSGKDGSTSFSLDSIEGEPSLVDFDFGILYAFSESFRFGIHFQQPYIDFYWEFFEF
jgi:hypothetical protein